MNNIRQEQHDDESAIYQCRIELGLTHMRSWLLGRQAAINREWMILEGDLLIRMQGEARSIARLLKIIEDGPAIKQLGA